MTSDPPFVYVRHFGDRPFCDTEACALAAALHPAGRDEILKLGLPPHVFPGRTEEYIAALLAGEELPADVLLADDGEHLPWAEQIRLHLFVTDSEERARWAVRRFAAMHAVGWLPETLRYVAQRVRAGSPLESIGTDLVALGRAIGGETV